VRTQRLPRRTRRILVAAALVAVAAPLAALGLPDAARAASLDVFALKGSAAGVRVTVQTGYSFVVQPDAMLPRAAATIEADQVRAIASPLDPGDDVDALPGIGVPTAEQKIQQGAATPFPEQLPFPSPFNVTVPPPLGGATPPPQFSQGVSNAIGTAAPAVNPILTAPYLHVDAAYPNSSSPGPQRATYPRGSSDNVPPDFPDLLGLISAHSSSGSASAAEGSGVADAGVGSAVSIPSLGLRIGRISSHVEVRGAGSGAVSTVVTTLHDVTLGAPSLPGVAVPQPRPGTSLLHIGALVLSATTQRSADAARATSHTSLQASGVTVAGQSARLDEKGFSVNGAPSPLNDVAREILKQLNSPECKPATPIDAPGLGSLTSVPALRIGLPALHNDVTHNGNEGVVSMTGPSICVATTAPIPGTNGNVAATPTIYTITLGDVSSSAYGVSFPTDTPLTGFSPILADTGIGGPNGTSYGIDTSGTAASGATATAPGHTSGAASSQSNGRSLLAMLTGGILSRRVVVLVAMLAELALLGTLWASWLMSRRRALAGDSPTNRMDLV
jgi:hypothetical protein